MKPLDEARLTALLRDAARHDPNPPAPPEGLARRALARWIEPQAAPPARFVAPIRFAGMAVAASLAATALMIWLHPNRAAEPSTPPRTPPLTIVQAAPTPTPTPDALERKATPTVAPARDRKVKPNGAAASGTTTARRGSRRARTKEGPATSPFPRIRPRTYLVNDSRPKPSTAPRQIASAPQLKTPTAPEAQPKSVVVPVLLVQATDNPDEYVLTPAALEVADN